MIQKGLFKSENLAIFALYLFATCIQLDSSFKNFCIHLLSCEATGKHYPAVCLGFMQKHLKLDLKLDLNANSKPQSKALALFWSRTSI